KIVKCQNRVEKANQQSKDFENQNKDLQDKYDVLKNQTTIFEMNNKELNELLKELIEKNNDLLAQMKLYSAYFDNDKPHRKQIADQQILFDKMSVQMVELDKYVRDLKNTVLEKDYKISELEECVRNKDLEIEKCLERLNVYENKLHKMGQTNQTVHMIMPSKDNLYNGRKGIGFENPSYFEKAKDLRPTLYDEKVIGLGYTPIFLTHSDEFLEIEKFKRSRENKIEFAYDYENLNASYVNEKINFEDDYFQDTINLDFEKIDFPFQQTSSLKPYILNEGHFVKYYKKVKVKDYEYYKKKMLLAKKDKDEQVLLAEDQPWMESSSDSDQEINVNMVFMAQIEKVLSDSKTSSSSADDNISKVSYYISESESESRYETSEYYDNTTSYGLFVNDNDDQEIFHDCENFFENLIESQINHNESVVDHNEFEGVDKLIRKFNKKIVKCLKMSTILEDDSVELVSGGANGFVNVALSNSATSSWGSTLVELISEFVALMFGEVLGEEASLPMDVEEETPTVSGGSRVAAERGVDTGRVKDIEYQRTFSNLQ
nr:hypothetical protein [Tanacetum cinerariifolium]